MYKNTSCAVKINNKITQFFKCERGLRQGDPLSPLLFNIFFNDIINKINEANTHPVNLDNINNFSTLAYADDIVITSTTKDGLQKCMDAAAKYCSDWGLEINYKKTKCMTLTKGNQKEKSVFTLNNNAIENVSQIKYLGVIITKKGSFNQTLTELSNKANRAIYALNAKIKLNKIPIKTILYIFDLAILPILLYACEIWLPYSNLDWDKWESSGIEKTHTKFIKRLLGVNRSTTNVLVRGEVGRYPLQRQALIRNILFIQHLEAKQDDEIVKQAYKYEQMRDHSKTTIFNSIRTLLINHNENDIIKAKQKVLKQIVNQIFTENWRTKVNACHKGKTYRLIKNDINYEMYLHCVKNRKHRVAMTKLRVSDHNLMIEQARRMRPHIPMEQRICSLCKTLEDETHFLLTCCRYENRNTLIQQVEQVCPNFKNIPSNDLKLSYILSQENIDLLKHVASKIHEWFKMRNQRNSHETP